MVLMAASEHLQRGPRLISVVVPTHNRPVLLRGALESIRALEGNDVQFEILVCDNGISRETRQVAESYNAIYLPVETSGPSAARNAGLRHATGQFIAFLDDDDVWLKNHIRPHIGLLDSRPDLDAVLGRVISTDPDLKVLGKPWPEQNPGEGNDLLRKMLSGYFPQIGSVVARGNICQQIGFFDVRLIGGEDLDWLLRIARRRKLGFVSVSSMLFRTKPHGVYDIQYRQRAHFDRAVFLRHALPEWRIWKSPGQFIRAYTGTLSFFFWYFNSVALEHAQQGKRKVALSAIASAYYVFPLRALYHTIFAGNLRKALLLILFGNKSISH
jgi:glycosyltransferase involved in cell wall biosynthesis